MVTMVTTQLLKDSKRRNNMNFQSDIIRGDEKAVFSLRSLYSSFGFKQFRLRKFEEYDLYVKNKDFLVSN